MKRILSKIMAAFVVIGFLSSQSVFAYTFPSTNENNILVGDRPFVTQTDVGVGYVVLDFVNDHTNSLAYFEYRIDGVVKTSGTQHPVVIGDYIYPGVSVDTRVTGSSLTVNKTLNAVEYVEIRLALGGERDWDFDWTRFNVEKEPFIRIAEITSPLDAEEVWGLVSFEATLTDEDGDDAVQWAVRKGTCAASTGTVFGNVDGFNDKYEWDHSTFSAVADTSTWELGDYCFVFNPKESSGDTPIRLTREFVVIDPDIDDDGVLNDIDYCPNTVTEAPFLGLGTNRWYWDGELKSWETLLPKGQQKKAGNTYENNLKKFTIDETYGCSCSQILDLIKDASGDELLGHYKYGCSKSILEDFILDMNDGVLDGRYILDEFEVPGYDEAGRDSNIVAAEGVNYLLESTGTYTFAKNWTVGGIADAMYSLRPDNNWVLGSLLPSPYTDYLRLRVDSIPVDWIGSVDTHEYTYEYEGTGEKIHFNIFDGGAVGDNKGNLHVRIFVEL